VTVTSYRTNCSSVYRPKYSKANEDVNDIKDIPLPKTKPCSATEMNRIFKLKLRCSSKESESMVKTFKTNDEEVSEVPISWISDNIENLTKMDITNQTIIENPWLLAYEPSKFSYRSYLQFMADADYSFQRLSLLV
jgi:hypothetical protein